MALRGVSLDVPEGSVVTVLGANGAGKTTLLRTISGVLDPEKGSVALAGEPIAGIDPDVIVTRGVGARARRQGGVSAAQRRQQPETWRLHPQ